MAQSSDIAAIMGDWRFIRSQTVDFIGSLGDGELPMRLPRPGLDTFCKHFQEMLDVQDAYTTGILQGSMDFSNVADNEDYKGGETADELVARAEEAEGRLLQALKGAKEDAEVEWPEEGRKMLVSHLANLCMHEAFHLGQLVAFCYATGVRLPEHIVTSWALSPQD